jgi:hypothetical protein
LYQGHPLTSRGVGNSFTLPDKITIYQGPHERSTRNITELEQMVADTVWHEIAHISAWTKRRSGEPRKSTVYSDPLLHHREPCQPGLIARKSGRGRGLDSDS